MDINSIDTAGKYTLRIDGTEYGSIDYQPNRYQDTDKGDWIAEVMGAVGMGDSCAAAINDAITRGVLEIRREINMATNAGRIMKHHPEKVEVVPMEIAQARQNAIRN